MNKDNIKVQLEKLHEAIDYYRNVAFDPHNVLISTALKVRKCVSCGSTTHDDFPRQIEEECYCWVCICRGKAR